MADESKLKCVECGFENETQRIYCHNCGSKLDRSVLPPDLGRVESPEKRAKRVSRLVNPKPGFMDLVLLPLVKTLAWAAGIASAVLMVRPPSGLPEEPSKEDAIEARVLGIQMEEEQRKGGGIRMSVDEKLANRYMTASIRKRTAGFLGEEWKLVGGAVDFEPGRCRVWAKCSLFDWPLYFAADYQFKTAGGKLVAEPVGGSIGGLPVHPLLARYAALGFGPFWEQLKREKRIVLDMEAAELLHDQIVFVTRPPDP